MVKDLEKIEENLLVFYQYPKQIQASIYSTNMIKRKTKPKAEFPSGRYARILLWLNNIKEPTIGKIYLHKRFDSFEF